MALRWWYSSTNSPATRMAVDSVLDLLEARRGRIAAVVLLVVLAFFFVLRPDSVEVRMSRVCGSLYRLARTPADSAAIDTSRTGVRAPDNTAVIPTETCGDLRRSGRLK